MNRPGRAGLARVTDLHAYHQRLHGLPTLRHVTLEIHRRTQAGPPGR